MAWCVMWKVSLVCISCLQSIGGVFLVSQPLVTKTVRIASPAECTTFVAEELVGGSNLASLL